MSVNDAIVSSSKGRQYVSQPLEHGITALSRTIIASASCMLYAPASTPNYVTGTGRSETSPTSTSEAL